MLAEQSGSYGPAMTTTRTATAQGSDPVGRRPGLMVAAVLVTVAAWASAFVAIRGVRDSFEPGGLALGRLAAGSAALTAAAAVEPGWLRPTGREWALVGVCGVTWFAGYNVALNAAEQRVDAGYRRDAGQRRSHPDRADGRQSAGRGSAPLAADRRRGRVQRRGADRRRHRRHHRFGRHRGAAVPVGRAGLGDRG